MRQRLCDHQDSLPCQPPSCQALYDTGMNPSSQSNALTDAEIETLEERLSAIDPDDSMAVEELDGFCAALACSPEPIARDALALHKKRRDKKDSWHTGTRRIAGTLGREVQLAHWDYKDS